MAIRAVLFDIGGVVLESPIKVIQDEERRQKLPKSYLSVLIEGPGKDGAFQKLERNELSIPQFYELFNSELNNVSTGNKYYREYCSKRGISCPVLPTKLDTDATALHVKMTTGLNVNQDYVKAIAQLRKAGYKVAALTNNHQDSESKGNTNAHAIKHMFDHFIESSIVGLRKPDPRFYQYALDKLQCKPEEVAFLDDLGFNLKAAATMGLHTFHVKLGSERQALVNLGKLLGIDLVSPASKL